MRVGVTSKIDEIYVVLICLTDYDIIFNAKISVFFREIFQEAHMHISLTKLSLISSTTMYITIFTEYSFICLKTVPHILHKGQ